MPRRAAEDAPRIEVRSRADLRAWLAAHHDAGRAHWLVAFRKHHPDHLPPREAVGALLCWGWIDSLPRALDADRTMILIAPRNPKSSWSAVNKAHAERARATGAMTPAGEAAIAAAKANGAWSALDAFERLEVPPDLAAALAPPARAVFDAWPRSVRRGTLEWLGTARTSQTRAARIAAIAGAAAHGERPAAFARKPRPAP
jgi:uncharacterized protein YdeI (YjbR/CyaY-like superfamily)